MECGAQNIVMALSPEQQAEERQAKIDAAAAQERQDKFGER